MNFPLQINEVLCIMMSFTNSDLLASDLILSRANLVEIKGILGTWLDSKLLSLWRDTTFCMLYILTGWH